jgi:hypothetical protein
VKSKTFQRFSGHWMPAPEEHCEVPASSFYYLLCGCDQSGFTLQPDLAMMYFLHIVSCL